MNDDRKQCARQYRDEQTASEKSTTQLSTSFQLSVFQFSLLVIFGKLFVRNEKGICGHIARAATLVENETPQDTQKTRCRTRNHELTRGSDRFPFPGVSVVRIVKVQSVKC